VGYAISTAGTAKDPQEHEMNIEELAPIRPGQTTALPKTASILETEPDLLERLPGASGAEEALAARVREQTALYQFTDRLQRTRSLTETYEPALDAIISALQCNRAAILLCDASGTMKFVAARRLSEQYRRAVEGHSPWSPDSENPEPICVKDVAKAALPEPIMRAVLEEGIGALAFIPLLARGRVIGKFMTYYDAPHAFTRNDVDLAATVARQLAFAVDRIRAEEARVAAELALRESEARKSAILESALDAVITMDQDGRIVDFNPAAELLMRCPREVVIGKTVAETMIPERFRAAHESGVGRFLRTGRGPVIGRRFETVGMRADGSEFEAEIAVTATSLESGGTLFTAYLRDVTEGHRAQRAAHHLAAVVESSDDAIVSKDLDGLIRSFNQAAERMFGYKAEEVVGKPVTILIPADRQHEEPEILARIRRGERVDHYETVRRRKDGTLFDVSLTVSPVKDDRGTIIGASKIARDITERKIAEARLRESERHLQEIIAAIPAAIYTTDAQGRITFYNEAAVDLAGRVPQIGTDEWCVTWKLYHPDGTPLPHDQCPMAVALREGRPIRNMEAVAERPDGTRVPFIPYPTPLRNDEGVIVGAINMLVDVSERKQAETQQRVLLNELNHRVKNNMQMLQSLLETAARRTESPDAREVLEEASGRICAMAAAQRVLYATPDATRFNAREFLKSVCQTASQAFPQEVEIDCEAEPVLLSNDAAMPLALIANELLTNAVKHGLKDGSGRIRVALKKETGSFLFYVEDDGPGFDLRSVGRQMSGLALVQGLARQLRGRFDVSRTPATRCSLEFQ
jgi:PAS domain S-box-containing protein